LLDLRFHSFAHGDTMPVIRAYAMSCPCAHCHERGCRDTCRQPLRLCRRCGLCILGLRAAVALLDAGLVFYRLQNSGGSSPEWVRLTNLIDSATAPAVSPDGRMLAFIRGPDPFVSKGETYLKLLPGGAPVQPTHADTMKMSPVFSPDGSQIAYTVPGRRTRCLAAPGRSQHGSSFTGLARRQVGAGGLDGYGGDWRSCQ
jgi:WD40-like Beta Propeller Repeat